MNEAALPADAQEATPGRGPSLSGLLGRKAGSLAGYSYSDAMRASDVIWSGDTLQAFLLRPSLFIPRNKMAFNGLKREGEMESSARLPQRSGGLGPPPRARSRKVSPGDPHPLAPSLLPPHAPRMTLDPATWTLPAALDGLPWPDLWASVLLVLVLWICRKIVVGLVRMRTDLPPHVLRRWVVSSRNVVLFLILIGLVLIWAPQLRTFALSIAAVAVAIVVATKELILCVSGALVRASTRAFTVGDWIDVGGIRGEVVDHTLLATTLQEFQPNSFHYTGRTAVIPNSLLVTAPVRNLTVVRDYTFHTFALTFEPDLSLDGLEAEVARIVETHYGPHREKPPAPTPGSNGGAASTSSTPKPASGPRPPTSASTASRSRSSARPALPNRSRTRSPGTSSGTAGRRQRPPPEAAAA